LALYLHKVGLALLLFAASVSAQNAQRLSLREAILIALQSNEDVLTARNEIDAAAGRVLQAGRIANPDLFVTYNEISSGLNLSGAGERDIGLSQTIEFPGKRGSRVNAAEIELSIATLSVRRTQTLVTSRVKDLYFKALFAAEVVGNIQLTISLLGEFLETITQRYQAGSSTYLDVIRTKVELTRMRNDMSGARRDHEIHLGELNVILGRPFDLPIFLTDSLSYIPVKLSMDSTVELLTRQSATMEIASRQVARSGALVDLTSKSYLPDFSLGIAFQKRAARDSPPGASGYLGVNVGVSIPLWFWQGPRGDLKLAEASLGTDNVRLEATRRRIQSRISASYKTTSVAEEQLRVFSTSLLMDIEEELRAGISAYQNNQIDVLNLLDIYRTFRTTKLEYSRALYNISTAAAQLEAAGELPE